MALTNIVVNNQQVVGVNDEIINDDKNLVNNDAVAKRITNKIPFTSGPGYVRYANEGEVVADNNYLHTDYVDITGITRLVYNRVCSTSNYAAGIAFYDAEKNRVGGSKIINNSNKDGYMVDVRSVPENAVYARFSYWADEKRGKFF